MPYCQPIQGMHNLRHILVEYYAPQAYRMKPARPYWVMPTVILPPNYSVAELKELITAVESILSHNIAQTPTPTLVKRNVQMECRKIKKALAVVNRRRLDIGWGGAGFEPATS